MSDIILKGEKRESIAVLNQQLLEKEPDTLDAVELQQEIQGDSYLPQLYAALERGTKKYPSDFYIVCINQRFRLFELVNRTFFIDRLSCPTPDFDQSVYKYTKKDDRLEFLWSIPDQQTCESYRLDPLGFLKAIMNNVDTYSPCMMGRLNKKYENSTRKKKQT